MNFRCICSTLFITLVVTLIVVLILGLFGVTTITIISPIILAILLLVIGFINAITVFYILIYINCNNKCYIKCFTSKLFLLFLFSVSLVIFVLIGFVTFLSYNINLLIFAIAMFLTLGILFTKLSILFPLLNKNNCNE